MKTIRFSKAVRALAVLLAVALALGCLPALAAEESGAVLTFSDAGVAETVSGSGYSISGTTLTVSAAGTYTVTGSCGEGNIVVKKGTTGVTLILSELDLTCSSTAPLTCNKNTGVTLQIEGAVTLTDAEDPANEDSADEALAEAFEGAAIKVKSGGSLTITGGGTLTADGSKCKNGVKGGAEATVTVDMDGALVIKAANNGLASDGSVVVKAGTLDITAGNEGVKSEPDEDDTASAGTVTVFGGELSIEAASDGIQAANAVNIVGGTFTIHAQSDGIQSNGTLTVTDGAFDITTLNGYQSSGFNADTMSCKGLKASESDEDAEESDCLILITGGVFTLNTADDAVHSDGSIQITGGSFDIWTGDDGVHADADLTLGSEAGLERDPYITVHASYEGLEAGNLYILGGKYHVTASDDGINAAGGSSNGTDPGGGWGNHFRPGGPGGPGGGGSGGDYSIQISGGLVYVNADGDGLDSNGALTLTGGEIEVWGQSNADNEPLDSDGTLTIQGATVFAAGARGMGYPNPSGGQSSVMYTKSISAGSLLTVTNGSSPVFQTNAPKSAQFAFYSSPSLSGGSISAGSGSVSCSCSAWAHQWDEGAVTTEATTEAAGVLTYTCAVCGATERQTIPTLAEAAEEEPEEPETDEGYSVKILVPEHCTVLVYNTQDVSGAPDAAITADSDNATVLSRNSDTGAPDSSGDGQVNFVVKPEEGCEVEDVTVTGSYKNLKLISEGVYRVTKITAGDVVITVTVKQTETEPVVTEVRSLDREGTAVTAALACGEEGVTAWCAAYSAEGRLLSLDPKELAANAVTTLSFTVPEDAATVTIFLLDGDFTSLCDSKTI